MELDNQPIPRQLVEEILQRDDDPIAKVQLLINLGVEEEVANELVERYQIGQQAAVYYEQLPLRGYNDL